MDVHSPHLTYGTVTLWCLDQWHMLGIVLDTSACVMLNVSVIIYPAPEEGFAMPMPCINSVLGSCRGMANELADGGAFCLECERAAWVDGRDARVFLSSGVGDFR